MKVLWAARAWRQYLKWQQEDAVVAAKINELIENARRTPFTGLGKPEPLREKFAGLWSRRITAEHRLIYRVTGSGENQQVEIIQCRLHY